MDTRNVMNTLELTYELRRNGYTQQKLADEFGVSRGFVNHVIHGRKSSPDLEARIAGIIGRDPATVWPVTKVTLPQACAGAQ